MKTFIAILLIILAAIGAYWYWGRGEEVSTTPVENEGPVVTVPDTLETTYITAVDWPPQIRVIEGEYECVEAGEETGRAGQTERRVVDGREYCRTTVVEGAAGSIYTQYAYVFEHEGSVRSMTFSTRATQCANYEEAEMQECEDERESFDIDTVADQAAQALVR